MKKVVVLFLIMVMLLGSVAEASASDSRNYSSTSVAHRFNTKPITKTDAETWSLAADAPSSIVYVNKNDSSDRVSSYHRTQFINPSGTTMGASYQNVYSGGICSITSFGSYGSSAATIRAQIKNRYYGTSQSYYLMDTSGTFYAHC